MFLGLHVKFRHLEGVSKPGTPSVHIKIAGIYGCSSPLKMVLIGIDPYPFRGCEARPDLASTALTDLGLPQVVQGLRARPGGSGTAVAAAVGASL